MPEPVTLVVIGVGLYAWMKGRGSAPAVSNPPPQQLATEPATTTGNAHPISDVSGTGSDAPLATNGSVTSPVPLSGSLAASAADQQVAQSTALQAPPVDLVDALDNETALAMRAYAALNPADFQAFLTRYADRLVLRNDLMFEALTNPPDGGYELTPAMLASMGNAAYKVGQAINGVAVGKSVDVFGLGASVAGAIPGVPPDLVTTLQAAAMGYRTISAISDVIAVAGNAGVSVTDLTGLMGLGGSAGAFPGLAALPLGGVLMAVGLVVDIGFTIISDKPDLQKAVDIALDVASLVVLFIPVIGLVIALVIQLVKFIIDLFGDELFGGGGKEHEQREILETARYGQNLDPMFPALADALTPRELLKVLIEWGSGYCGGKNVVAMATGIYVRAGDTFMLGGRPYTVPPEQDNTLLYFADNNVVGGCYYFRNTMWAPITNDEMAWILGAYGGDKTRIHAMAQVGIADWRKTQFNDTTINLISARAIPMHDFLVKYHLSLDQCDSIALEYRAQPHLNELAKAYGWATWQEMLGSVIADEWHQFMATITNGSLSDFAHRNGYPTMYKYREAAFKSFEDPWATAHEALLSTRAQKAAWTQAYQDWAIAQSGGYQVGGM